MKRIILLLFSAIVTINAQQISISGKITDHNNTPLQLANVTIKYSVVGTSTDQNGEFNIEGGITSQDVLVISYIGFVTREIPVISLNPEQKLIIMLDRAILTSQTVLVQGSIGQEGITPMSFSKLERETIEESYINQDIPEMLSYLPSTTFYSEGGAGLGYNYLSIRGFDQRRISVSINGIPQNDPEDHNVYWVDFPDLLESTSLIHVQRGAGAGITGYPSIGGSINIITSTFSDKPKMQLDASLGSFNTRKYSASFSSGLIGNKYSVYAKISQTLSDGYRDKNWIDFRSYYIAAVRYDENVTTQLNFYGGPIADGLTYNGLAKFAIMDRELRKHNYSYWEADEKEYTYVVPRRDDEKENFSQPHFELLNDIKINDDLTFNSALFLVLGEGFFDYDGSWSVFYDDYFRLDENGFEVSTDPTNALIRAYVDNAQWGWIPRFSWNHNNGNLIVGGELRFHNSKHWGNINYAENLPEGVTKEYQYYYYEGANNIFNIFANERYDVNDKLNILLEAQLAYHKYKLHNEKYVGTEFEVDNLFFNPKFGLNYKFNPNFSGFFSLARVSREPRLKNYYDAAESSAGEVPQFELDVNGNYDFSKPLVQPESLTDFELGITYNLNDLSLNANVFYMMFNDEIVKQGQVDRFGQPITGNMEKTIHAGFEFSGAYKFMNHFDIILNGAYSNNYISEGREYLSENEYIDLKNNSISGFPDVTFNGILKFNYAGLFAQFAVKYVGRFFSDNYADNLTSYFEEYPGFTDYTDNEVDAYLVSNFYLSYEFNLEPYFNLVKVYGQVNNIFDNLYASYAIGKEFFPAAERYVFAGLKIGL